MTDPRTLGKNLKSARENSGYSVEYAARMIDVKPKDLQKWETGKDTPDDRNLSLLARLYSVPVEELTGTTKPSPEAEAPRTEPPRPSADHTSESEHGTASESGERTSDEPKREAHRESADEPPHDPPRYTPRETVPSRGNGKGETPFSEYLEEGETLLWTGKPVPRIRSSTRFFSKSLGAVLFFAFYIISSFTDQPSVIGQPLTFAVIGLLLFVLLFGGEILTEFRRFSVSYAYTNRRVLILKSIGEGDCIEYRYNSGSFQPHFICGKGSYGSIILSSADYRKFSETQEDDTTICGVHFGSRRRSRGIDIPPDPRMHLIGIENAEQVYHDLLAVSGRLYDDEL